MKVESPDTLWSAPGSYFNAELHNNSRPKPDLYYSKSDKCGFHMLLQYIIGIKGVQLACRWS